MTGNMVQFQAEAKVSSALCGFYNGFGARPDSYPMVAGEGGVFLGV
jgi:hypothetical protein